MFTLLDIFCLLLLFVFVVLRDFMTIIWLIFVLNIIVVLLYALFWTFSITNSVFGVLVLTSKQAFPCHLYTFMVFNKMTVSSVVNVQAGIKGSVL